MAQIISTYDGFALSGHIARGQLQSSIPIQTGVVESFKQELECTINPLATNQVMVGTGMGIAGYLAWENSEQVMLEFFGNGTYNIVCTIDATNNPATIAIEYLATSTTLITENLVANPNGIHQQLLATATVVSGAVDTLVDKRELINMQTTIDAIKVKFANYLPLLGGTMTGTINAKGITNSTTTVLNGLTTINANLTTNGAFTANGGSFMKYITTRGENIDLAGGASFAYRYSVQKADGTGSTPFVTYKDANEVDISKHLDMNTSNITFESGQLITKRNAQRSILFSELPDNTIRSIALTHTNGNLAGDLVWDRTNGNSGILLRLTSVLTGAPFCGITARENSRIFNNATDKFLMESATFALAQVQTLNNQLSTQEQLDVAVQRIDTLEQSNNLLQMQMNAIINGEEIPLSLPQMRAARMAINDNELTTDLRTQLEQAQLDLLEEEFQSAVTSIDIHIEALEQSLKEQSDVVQKSAKGYFGAKNKKELLDQLVLQKQELISNYESGQ